ncbi:GrlR family regulatory protein [Caenispirillum bisanense]|uniref:GrlR family regulatory protein n=1 Tax=Caenispirillum bisanense TaxID=414052 RepID=UPI0031D5FC87
MSEPARQTERPDILPLPAVDAAVEGFWIVRVEKDGAAQATGATLTLDRGHLTGGDDSYYYLGTYRTAADGALVLDIDATRYAGDPAPALDDLHDMVFLRLTLWPQAGGGAPTWAGEVVDRVDEDATPVPAVARRVASWR